MLLVGSRALQRLKIDTGRVPLDTDVIATFDELTGLTAALRERSERVVSIPLSQTKTVLKADVGDGRTRIVEVEIHWPGSTGRALVENALVLAFTKETEVLGMKALVPPLSVLYTLKMSHRYLKNSPHFRKTRSDIMLMRSHGAEVFDHDWLKRRESETYTYRHPKLNVMKKDFFRGDGVDYVYEHDDIHRAMAHRENALYADPQAIDVPAYTLYGKDGEQVKSDKAKFFALPERIRLNGVLEEAQVLALERSQVPFRGKVDPRRSFDMALEKVCTSITSGWFREFAWENFDKVEAMYEPNYVDRFWRAVDEGRVGFAERSTADASMGGM